MSTIRPSTPVTPNSIYEQMDPDHLVEMDECPYCFAITEGGCDCVLDERSDDEESESESSDYDSVEEEERYINSVIAQINTLEIPTPRVTRYSLHFPPA